MFTRIVRAGSTFRQYP